MQVAFDALQFRGLHIERAAPGAGEHLHAVGERLLAGGRQRVPDPGVADEHDAQAEDRPHGPEGVARPR